VTKNRKSPCEPLDVTVENHGSIALVVPETKRAREWVEENVLQGELLWWGRGFVCEPRYLGDLVEGMQGDGLTVG
jgi:hypothetical protein